MLGDTVKWLDVKEMTLKLEGLLPGDRVNIVTAAGSETLLTAQTAGSFSMAYPMKSPGFARVEVQRIFLPGVPPLPALISNPIYFDA
jgi:hypothetical protein